MRFNEIMAGARADLVCKIFGDDYDELERLAGEVRDVLASIPGGGETEFDSIGKHPDARNPARPRRAAQIQRPRRRPEPRSSKPRSPGKEVGTLIEGNRRTPIVVRLAEERRNDLDRDGAPAACAPTPAACSRSARSRR